MLRRLVLLGRERKTCITWHISVTFLYLSTGKCAIKPKQRKKTQNYGVLIEKEKKKRKNYDFTNFGDGPLHNPEKFFSWVSPHS